MCSTSLIHAFQGWLLRSSLHIKTVWNCEMDFATSQYFLKVSAGDWPGPLWSIAKSGDGRTPQAYILSENSFFILQDLHLTSIPYSRRNPLFMRPALFQCGWKDWRRIIVGDHWKGTGRTYVTRSEKVITPLKCKQEHPLILNCLTTRIVKHFDTYFQVTYCRL